MIKRLLILTTLSVMLSGCFMVPMALVGPAVSGFSSASILQASLGIAVKEATGKSIAEHAFDALARDNIKQTYFPEDNTTTLVKPKLSSKKYTAR
mgnify:CR=1 FL=1